MSRFPTELFGLQNVRIANAFTPYPDMEQPKTKTGKVSTSKLGTPVYADITFKGGSYGDGASGVFGFRDVKLDMCIVTIDQAKNIVKTAVVGKNGTIKEYIGMNDYTVNINGVIFGENGQYPIQEVADLKEMLIAPVSLSIQSWYLQNWEIDNIIVESYNIPQVAGGISQQPFTIKAVSDKPVSIILS